MEKSNDILIPEFERLLKSGHMVEFVPRGVSMRPFIEGGCDKVILKTCKEPKVGIIVLARINGTYVLHRIYKIKDEQIILRGDGNLKGQEVCTFEDIIGRVVRLKGRAGKRKRLTKARIWRRTPTVLKWLVLKVYSKIIKLQNIFYED
jgi:hypothetical protein